MPELESDDDAMDQQQQQPSPLRRNGPLGRILQDITRSVINIPVPQFPLNRAEPGTDMVERHQRVLEAAINRQAARPENQDGIRVVPPRFRGVQK